MLEEKHCHASMSLLCASVDCYVCVNIKCNMQNDTFAISYTSFNMHIEMLYKWQN